uniref:Uncharacterized protein n=1 Tax=Varanus komodoensis TaxID=61221 RepID=A0A8D2LJS8_VARKO
MCVELCAESALSPSSKMRTNKKGHQSEAFSTALCGCPAVCPDCLLAVLSVLESNWVFACINPLVSS